MDLFQHSTEENSYEPYSRLKHCSIFYDHIAGLFEYYKDEILEEDEYLKDNHWCDVDDAAASGQLRNMTEEFDSEEFEVYRAHCPAFKDDFGFNLKYEERFIRYLLTIYETENA